MSACGMDRFLTEQKGPDVVEGPICARACFSGRTQQANATNSPLGVPQSSEDSLDGFPGGVDLPYSVDTEPVRIGAFTEWPSKPMQV